MQSARDNGPKLNKGKAFHARHIFKLKTTKNTPEESSFCVSGEHIIMPLFSRKAFWSPTDVPQLQNTLQPNNPALFPATAPSGSCTQSRQEHTQLVHKVVKAGRSLAHAHARLPWLPQTSTPRRQASFIIILLAGLGRSDAVFGLRNKKDVSGDTRAGLRSSAVALLRWRLLRLGSCLRCLPGRALPL